MAVSWEGTGSRVQAKPKAYGHVQEEKGSVVHIDFFPPPPRQEHHGLRFQARIILLQVTHEIVAGFANSALLSFLFFLLRLHGIMLLLRRQLMIVLEYTKHVVEYLSVLE